mmetsp:Transcript_13495/g.18500  ORF Transcript_13495/g.18500 Transcript_13495/m.18500 type:complete len:680 (-) Transcript_13495:341-2380(-)|eukprot:CAMPEP_0196588710 /NCGR_PEP_ID=MMETSP1081-20130531/61432_1 /TAXON_ID=36882 /ORGANISM="Pyramimonas amylifera, Strain CCMP720" /LENGTH=679 /DNA_ID=CAMNT_0041911297 /DNA_START=293 /DNA_END=2332 /DNA_ORIENTATION=+
MAASIEDLFVKLQDQVKDEKLNGVLATCDLILAQAPSDPDALRCAVVAQLRLSNFPQALATVAQAPQEMQAELSLEKAYALYRLNQLDEALAVCTKAPESRASACLQLRAQVLYRQGNFRDCIAVYENLFNTHKLESQDICTNVLAAYVAAGRAKDVPAIMRAMQMNAADGFEIAYNSATALAELGDLHAAEQQLNLAQRVGTEALVEEEASEQEIAQELLPLTVQLGYVAQQAGKLAEAAELYNSALRLDQNVDLTSRAVATNNLVAARGPTDLFDAQKRLDRLMKDPQPTCVSFTPTLDTRLTANQKQTLLFTRLLVLLHSNKLPACREVAASLAALYPSADVPLLVQAALLGRGDKKEKASAGKADEMLASYAATHPGAVATRVQLMRAQIAASAGNWARAAEALSSIGELANKPAVVATCAALMEAAGDIDGAEAVLDRHLASSMDTEYYSELCTTAANLKEKHGRPSEAASLYRALLSSSTSLRGGSSVIARARLVRAEASLDLCRAEEEAQGLPPLVGVDSLDLASLEAGEGINLNTTVGSRVGLGRVGSFPELSQPASAAAGGESRGGERERKPNKRKRKPRFPKGFDPTNPPPPPDPERWLPKQDRTTFKSKSSRRKLKEAVNVKGSQGAGHVAMELEAKLEDPKPEDSKSTAAPKPPSAKNKGGKKGKKK